MFTSGVGALVDLPNFSVLVRGIDDWSYDPAPPELSRSSEPRLLAAVQRLLGMRSASSELRPAPWLDGIDTDPNGAGGRVGVPVMPFPQWLRCTACDELAPLDSQHVRLRERQAAPAARGAVLPRRLPAGKQQAAARRGGPLRARLHGRAPRRLPVRRVRPQRRRLPQGATHPPLRMEDRGGNLGANVEIRLHQLRRQRNIREAMGERGAAEPARAAGAGTRTWARSTQPLRRSSPSCWWSARPTSGSRRPCPRWPCRRPAASALEAKVARALGAASSRSPTPGDARVRSQAVPARSAELRRSGPTTRCGPRSSAPGGAPAEATRRREQRLPGPAHPRVGDLHAAKPARRRPTDFTLRAAGRRARRACRTVFADVVQAERLREVRALVGFTRLDAPDPEDPDLVVRAPLSRAATPEWVPASEVRGEGIFLRVPEELLAGVGGPRSTTRDGAGGAPRGVRALPAQPLLRPDHRPTSTRCATGPAPGTSPCTPCRTC